MTLTYHDYSRCVQADILVRKQVIVNVVKCLPALQPRSLQTGHRFAPLYTPLSITTFTQTVQQLKCMWAARNAEVASAVRTARRLALATMHQEVAQWREVRVRSISHAKKAAQAARRAAQAEQTAALRSRAKATVERKARQAARKAVHGASASVGAAIAAEARYVRGADQYKAQRRQEAATQAMARARWLQGLQEGERVYELKGARTAKRREAAAAVRARGYTQEVHQKHEAAQQCQEVAVADAKAAREAGQVRAGLPGGLWGAATPREAGRAAYPMAVVMAATDTSAVCFSLFFEQER